MIGLALLYANLPFGASRFYIDIMFVCIIFGMYLMVTAFTVPYRYGASAAKSPGPPRHSGQANMYQYGVSGRLSHSWRLTYRCWGVFRQSVTCSRVINLRTACIRRQHWSFETFQLLEITQSPLVQPLRPSSGHCCEFWTSTTIRLS